MIDVLVVDDDFRVAEINAAYVAQVPGFRVTARAHTAAQALVALESRHIDLVLLDHYLPDESGVTLVARMRQLGHHADVIMVTAARDVATLQSAMRHGALQYLVKPFSFAGLRAKLDGYATLRRTLEGVGPHGEAGQNQVDRIFSAFKTANDPHSELPKGHSAPTVDLIRRVLEESAYPVSAHEVAEHTGISRSTAQRYLKHLERAGRITLTLKYGDTGRPEHRYTWAAGTGRGD
ncbi:response regulator of citrate/malate metabolism [Streptomyces sp. Amel2xB2]|uniref:response regulator n=1 Tax=Streptomyces sp. Amel2xB2 TaxID=1305829 RepID=UPI000DB9BF5F|nr:response regulator [Streptomyces sp. Amel2xB2]RAJ70387.1 response regulator of citrate/malate metabolism [Streptomyces sp. Amel2xB2]